MEILGGKAEEIDPWAFVSRPTNIINGHLKVPVYFDLPV